LRTHGETYLTMAQARYTLFVIPTTEHGVTPVLLMVSLEVTHVSLIGILAAIELEAALKSFYTAHDLVMSTITNGNCTLSGYYEHA
jgi:hypothetical protein